MNKTLTPIRKPPSLGANATDVLSAAVAINTCGFILKLKIVGENDIHLTIRGEFQEILWSGGIPLEGKFVDPDHVLDLIAKGWVGVWVEEAGRNPHYSKEYHRATGILMPREEGADPGPRKKAPRKSPRQWAATNEDLVMETAQENMFGGGNTSGFCVACGMENDCEGDARGHPCEGCGEMAVYGADELMMELGG